MRSRAVGLHLGTQDKRENLIPALALTAATLPGVVSVLPLGAHAVNAEEPTLFSIHHCWEASLSASLVVGPVQTCSGIIRSNRSTSVADFSSYRGRPLVPRWGKSGLTRRCSGPAAPTAELVRWRLACSCMRARWLRLVGVRSLKMRISGR